MDTSSLTRLLEGCFGSVDPSPSSRSACTKITGPPEEHPTEEAPGCEPISPITESSLATAELSLSHEVHPQAFLRFFYPFVAQKPYHFIDVSSQTAPKSSHRKHQLATTFITTI